MKRIIAFGDGAAQKSKRGKAICGKVIPLVRETDSFGNISFYYKNWLEEEPPSPATLEEIREDQRSELLLKLPKALDYFPGAAIVYVSSAFIDLYDPRPHFGRTWQELSEYELHAIAVESSLADSWRREWARIMTKDARMELRRILLEEESFGIGKEQLSREVDRVENFIRAAKYPAAGEPKLLVELELLHGILIRRSPESHLLINLKDVLNARGVDVDQAEFAAMLNDYQDELLAANPVPATALQAGRSGRGAAAPGIGGRNEEVKQLVKHYRAEVARVSQAVNDGTAKDMARNAAKDFQAKHSVSPESVKEFREELTTNFELLATKERLLAMMSDPEWYLENLIAGDGNKISRANQSVPA